MNKFIIFSCLIVVITSLCASTTATNVNDCSSKTIDEVEKVDGIDSCCYYLYETENSKVQGCITTKKANVSNIVKEGKKSHKT